MLLKLLGLSIRTENGILSRLAALLPDTRWVVLMNSVGIPKRGYPDSVDANHIAALSAAIQALGERVLRDLHGGRLDYIVIGGELGLSMVVTLDRRLVLALNLQPNASLDAVLTALRQHAPSLLREAGLHLPENWLS
jgi:predicted regulator of Ras-like GTPase activity (Roadblock/LC7/MglB family)